MRLLSTRRLIFLSSWAASFAVGVLIFGMLVLSSVAERHYIYVLSGKPLPVLTQFVIDVHHKPGPLILALALVIVGTHALALHLAVARAKDAVSGIWNWLSLMTGTALVMTVYVVVGFLALLLPLASFGGGMQRVTPPSEMQLLLTNILILALTFGSLAYVVVIGFVMWKRPPVWVGNKG
jgi:hypothetical protein